MKKIFLVLSAAMLVLSACSKDDDEIKTDDTVYGSVNILFQSDTTFATFGELLVSIDGVTAATLSGSDSIFTKNDIVIEDTVVVTTQLTYDTQYTNAENYDLSFVFNRSYFSLDSKGIVLGKYYSSDDNLLFGGIKPGNVQAVLDLNKGALCDTIYLTKTGVVSNRK